MHTLHSYAISQRVASAVRYSISKLIASDEYVSSFDSIFGQKLLRNAVKQPKWANDDGGVAEADDSAEGTGSFLGETGEKLV